jgi:hypothetical protein
LNTAHITASLLRNYRNSFFPLKYRKNHGSTTPKNTVLIRDNFSVIFSGKETSVIRGDHSKYENTGVHKLNTVLYKFSAAIENSQILIKRCILGKTEPV